METLRFSQGDKLTTFARVSKDKDIVTYKNIYVIICPVRKKAPPFRQDKKIYSSGGVYENSLKREKVIAEPSIAPRTTSHGL